MQTQTSKKITLSTVKSFIKKNTDLFINVRSSFDGMIDGIEQLHNGFQKVTTDKDKFCHENSLGINGAWFVGSSRDYFTPYNDNSFTGIEVSNSCGTFILAVKILGV